MNLDLKRLNLTQILLSAVVVDSLFKPSLSLAILGVSLVGLELFRYWTEVKQQEADLKAFKEAFNGYESEFNHKLERVQEILNGKIATLDSRVGAYTAFRSK